jgi:hypothetical protein
MWTHVRNLTGALALGSAILLTPVASALAAPETQNQSGLVNIAVVDVLNPGTCVALCDTAVSIPVAANVAAQVCGVPVQVGVLARQTAAGGTFTCAVSGQSNRQLTATRAG